MKNHDDRIEKKMRFLNFLSINVMKYSKNNARLFKVLY